MARTMDNASGPHGPPGLLQTFARSQPHLVERVAHGQLAERGQGEDFRQQVCPEQVGEGLVDEEVCISHPGLGQDPVPFRVTGQEDGGLSARGLAQLWRRVKNSIKWETVARI